MDTVFHSVSLDKDKCLGCMNCIKRCPTQAIRVRRGKATIISERCIDCGECIRICPHHAKTAKSDPLSATEGYKYKIALPAPSLYGQFNNLDDVNYVLTALLQIGFDAVAEVARGAEVVSDATRKMFKSQNMRKPAISTACPAVIRLIRVRYPELIDNMITLKTPMDETARLAREEARAKTGLSDEDIGVFFITPCPAKITAIKSPLCAEKSDVNGAIAMSEVYPLLVSKMDKLSSEQLISLEQAGKIGVGWAASGGEASALLCEKYIAADGIENVIKILEEIEDEKLGDIEFVELNACTGGCVGGCLTVANTFVAKTRLSSLKKYLPVSCNHIEKIPDELNWDYPLEPLSVLKLADNVTDSMKLMNQVSQMVKNFPELDCGTCGAPTCRALAEDIVRGYASVDDCIFRLKDKMASEGKDNIEHLIPVPFRGIDEENI